MKALKRNSIAVLLLCFYGVIFGQTKVDTILNDPNRSIIVEYPSASRTSILNYEEGVFYTISCFLDTAIITIHAGAMVALPMVNLTDKTICSKFLLFNDVRIIRGYALICGQKRYFREDNYLKYGVNIIYENVDRTKLAKYECFLNNMKIGSPLNVLSNTPNTSNPEK